MKKNNYLTLGGLFVALHLLFIFMSKVLVGSEFILVVFVPLLSTIYSLKYGGKETIIFFITTFLLCFIFEPISTFIYVLPALICGTIYGILKKKNIKELSLVYISSLAHSLSLLIAFVSISFMFKEVEFFSIFKMFINKSGSEFYACVYLILILLGVLEAFVTHIIVNNELKRLGYKEIDGEVATPLWMNICLVICLILYIILSIINPVLSCYIFPFLLAFSIPNIIDFIILNKYKYIYAVVGLLFFSTLFLLPYISSMLYPGLAIFSLSPLIIINFVRVLYTNSLKYSNNNKNEIK